MCANPRSGAQVKKGGHGNHKRGCMPVAQGGYVPALQGVPAKCCEGGACPSHIPHRHVNHLLELRAWQSLRVLACMWSITRAWLPATCSTVQSSLAGLSAALIMTSQTYVAKHAQSALLKTATACTMQVRMSHTCNARYGIPVHAEQGFAAPSELPPWSFEYPLGSSSAKGLQATQLKLSRTVSGHT